MIDKCESVAYHPTLHKISVDYHFMAGLLLLFLLQKDTIQKGVLSKTRTRLPRLAHLERKKLRRAGKKEEKKKKS